MGRIGAPYGVKGWFHVQPFTAQPDGLSHYPHWWLGRVEPYREREVAESRLLGAKFVARLAGIEDREEALKLQGVEIAIPRDLLPPSQPGEVYWTDLMGLAVVNLQGESLGRIVDRIETGAQDVMVVEGNGKRLLIPFVEPLVREVDLADGQVTVDWGLDF